MTPTWSRSSRAPAGDSVAVYTGSSGEVTLLTTLTADTAYDASVADLDADGSADIAVAASRAHRIAVFKGSCS